MLLEIGAAGDQADGYILTGEGAGHMLQPHGPLIPPVSEELGVERRGKDGRVVFAQAILKRRLHDGHEVLGVVSGTGGRALRAVGCLEGEIGLGMGDLPVTVAAGPALLMEVEVVAVAGIALVAAPDLETGFGVTREGRDRMSAGKGSIDVIGVVVSAAPGERYLDGRGGSDRASCDIGLVGVEVNGLFNEMAVDEEELDPSLGKGLLDADAARRLARVRRCLRG